MTDENDVYKSRVNRLRNESRRRHGAVRISLFSEYLVGTGDDMEISNANCSPLLPQATAYPLPGLRVSSPDYERWTPKGEGGSWKTPSRKSLS